MIYVFGPFELDTDLYELRREREPVKLAPKAFDVLLHLVRQRERVVSKTELLDKLWPGEHVTESVLPANVNAIRKALGDEREQPRCVQTVHGRGYRFVAAVEERVPVGEPAEETEPQLFVGRERVMEELRGCLDRALSGRGGLVLLAGEPGIGKTRTAEQLAREARQRGALVVAGSCYEGEGAPAFWPWIQILRAFAAAHDDASLRETLGVGAADVAQLVPELRARLPGLEAVRAPDTDEARFRLFDSVASFLDGIARRRPIFVLLDDLHWADEPTLLLLRFVARELPPRPVLVVGAYRDVELRRTHPLAKILGELARLAELHRVTLRGLEEADVARFIELTAGHPADAELTRNVFRMTEGNPFFVQEVVRLLHTEGRLGEAVQEHALPQGVREVIGRRLDVLDESSNRLLRFASVVGGEFGVGVLEAIADTSPEAVLEGLERARAAGIVREEGTPGRWAFSHVLIRETLYEELSAPERIALHRRAGEVLELLLGPAADEHAAELARHFFQAAAGGDVERAVHYAVRGAERARALLAFEEAVALLERALQVLPLRIPVDEARRCELLIDLGAAQLAAGRREATLRTLRSAADIARRLERGDLLARVAVTWPPTLGRQMVVWNAEYRPLVEEALGVVDRDALSVRALLTSALALTPPDSNSMQRRGALSREAVALARRSGDAAALFRAMESRLWALTGPDSMEERLSVASEMVGLAVREGSEALEFDAREHRTRSLIAQGRLRDADLEIHACARLAEALRLPTYRLSVERFRLARELGDGRLEAAEARLQTVESWLGRIDDPDADMIRVMGVVWVSLAKGDLGQLAGLFDPFVSQSEHWIGPSGHVFVGYFHSILENFEAARRHFDRVAGQGFRDLPRDEDWLMSMALAAETAADLGDQPAAGSLRALLEPFANANVSHLHMRHYLGSAGHALGRLAALLGRDDEAAANFEAAVAMNAELGAGPALARTHYEYGRWLLARGGSGADRGRSLLADAEHGAETMGMKELLAKIRRVARTS